MKTINAFILFIFLLITACNQNSKTQKATPETNKIKPSDTTVSGTETSAIEKSKPGKPIYAPGEVLKDFRTFWDYYSRNVFLNEDFLAYNTSGKTISKTAFLTQLKSGKYIPLQVHSDSSALAYQLYKTPASADPTIADYMRNFSKKHLVYYKMKGKKIPTFSFSDVNGKTYTSENTKGSIVLFKCWFTSCSACIAEMPALNKLVEKYKDRKDILFISLAINDKKELQRFLSKTQFDYATVPGQETYMRDQLNVTVYPTHFLINTEGKVVYISDDADQIARHLEKESAL